MVSRPAFWRLTEAVIFAALLMAYYLQHLRLRELDRALSQTVQASERSNALVAAREKQIGELQLSIMSVSTAESAAGALRNNDPREKPLEVWIQAVRSLSDFSAKHPELMIPQMALLQEEDWLDIARDKLETEEDFRRALAKLRDLGRRKAAPDIGNALKAAIQAADGRIPSSPRELIPYLPTGFNLAILDQMIIDPSGPMDGRHPTMRYVLMERPVDAWDQPLVFHTFGGSASRTRIESERTAVSK